MKSSEIRKKFLNFFEKRGHAILPSASLIPENDSSVLFNTAGMQPLVPYLLGQKHPQGTRLANIQKCVRTGDLDDIGDNTHATFFEMMGNWSLGDYFKKETIEWSFQLLTDKEEGFGLDPQRLYVTCFEGDENAPKDEESAKIWQEIFDRHSITGNRIFFLPAKNNWWSPGDNGPCGPDTEMFYDASGKHTGGLTHEEFLEADEKQEVVEIWNDVFMEYQKKDGKVIGKLEQKNVDTGTGFERVTMVLQGKDNIFDTDIFEEVMKEIKNLSQIDNLKAQRIVADHLRTAMMLISDGVSPSGKDTGGVLRKILKRAFDNMEELGIPLNLYENIIILFKTKYSHLYKVVQDRFNDINKIILEEAKNYLNNRKDIEKNIDKLYKRDFGNTPAMAVSVGSGTSFVIMLDNTYGIKEIDSLKYLRKKYNDFPYDKELAGKRKKEHQELSRQGAEKKFKGGLGDNSEQTIKYHTATHLLHQALREVLGDHVSQKGSNITPERLRFDFTHPEKMTDEQKQKVEEIVNQKISENLPVNMVTLPKKEAEETGALHFFGEKYPDEVNVYYIGHDLPSAYSKEFCGGPHVKNTGELGKFKIQKEEAVSAGVRRIKAVLED